MDFSFPAENAFEGYDSKIDFSVMVFEMKQFEERGSNFLGELSEFLEDGKIIYIFEGLEKASKFFESRYYLKKIEDGEVASVRKNVFERRGRPVVRYHFCSRNINDGEMFRWDFKGLFEYSEGQ